MGNNSTRIKIKAIYGILLPKLNKYLDTIAKRYAECEHDEEMKKVNREFIESCESLLIINEKYTTYIDLMKCMITEKNYEVVKAIDDKFYVHFAGEFILYGDIAETASEKYVNKSEINNDFPAIVLKDDQWEYTRINIYKSLKDGQFVNNTGGCIMFCCKPLTRWVEYFTISNNIVTFSQHVIENGECKDVESVMNMTHGTIQIHEDDYIHQYYNWKIYDILKKLSSGKCKVDDFLPLLMIKNEEKYRMFSRMQINDMYWERLLPDTCHKLRKISSYEQYIIIQMSGDISEYEKVCAADSIGNINKNNWICYDLSGEKLKEVDVFPDDSDKNFTVILPEYDKYLLYKFYEHIHGSNNISIMWKHIVWMVENIKKIDKYQSFPYVCNFINCNKIEKLEGEDPIQLVNDIVKILGKINPSDVFAGTSMHKLISIYTQKKEIDIDKFDINNLAYSPEGDNFMLWLIDKINENKIICKDKNATFEKLANRSYNTSTKNAILTGLGK